MPSQKITQSTFIIQEDYTRFTTVSKETAAVSLFIDYQAKTFSIKPRIESGFVFKDGSKNSPAMWEAIGKCIAEAARIADQELFNPADRQG